MSRKIKVCIRTRPTASFAEKDIEIDADKNEVIIKKEGVTSTHVQSKQTNLQFRYDEVLHNASQEVVYEKSSRDIIENVLNGRNGTVMAYGQTGSGKTFTVLGDTEHYTHRGVAPRAIAQIFSEVSSRIESEFTISCSYMEIYQDKIHDLLEHVKLSNKSSSGNIPNLENEYKQGKKKDFTVLEDRISGKGVYVRGLTEIQVVSETEALSLLYAGQQARTIAQHQLNKNSNRAHSIFTLLIRQQSRSGVSAHRIRTSKLTLVDLAGSERLKKTTDATNIKASSVLRKESMYINQSLSFLEQCVLALNGIKHDNEPSVAYRQTKLTSVLKDSLGGNCMTVLLACIWGEKQHIEETCSTLRFAARMSKVQNKVSITETSDAKQLAKKHEATIRDLKQELLMHNALAERSGIKYEPYSIEESNSIARKIKTFLQASDDEFNEILGPFHSVRQVKETCLQFKKLLLQAEAKAQQIAMQLSNYDKEIGSPQTNHAEQNELKQIETSPQIEKPTSFVGEIDPSSGFGLGRAPDDDVPDTWKTLPIKSPTTPILPSKMEKSDALPPPEQNVQYLHEFNKTPEGASFVEATTIAQKALDDARKLLAQAARSVNAAKADIDVNKTKLEQRSNQNININNNDADIVDAEMFALMQNERAAKAEYRKCHTNWAQAKNNFDQKKTQAQAAKRQLLSAFQDWTATTSIPKRSNFSSTDEDTLDDQEQFDKMEMDRVVALDPDAMAFFQAKKNRRKICHNRTQLSQRAKLAS